MNKVRCFSCNKEVWQMRAEIQYGDLIEANQFVGINGFPSPKDGDMIACPNCGDIEGIKLGLHKATGYEVYP